MPADTLHQPPLVRAVQAGAAPDRLRVLFGHQSVGADIITGLTELGPSIAGRVGIEESRTPEAAPATHLLAHFRVGRNGAPDVKLRDFADALAQARHCIDVAMFKFCYVDIHDLAQARATWRQYSETFDELQRLHPRIVFAHVTVPLRSPPHTPLARLRQWLAGPHPEHARNRARETFNEWMRERYGHTGTLFDLAALESTGPQGRRYGRPVGGTFVPALHPDYTHDGGHLNALGRKHAARALLTFLFTR